MPFSAIANLIGSVIGSRNNRATNGTNYRIAQLNNRTQIALQDKQNQVNYDNWKEQNAYNHPQQQVARLWSAGINPYINPQGVGSGTSQSPAAGTNVPQLTTPTMQSFDSSPYFTGIADNIAQARFRAAESKKLEEETKGAAIDNLTKNAENLERIENLRSDTENKYVNASLTGIQKRLAEDTYDSVVDLRHYEAQKAGHDVDISARTAESIRLDNLLRELKLENYPQEFASQLASVWSQVRLNNAKTATEFAQQRKLAQDVTESIARTCGLRLQNGITNRISSYLVQSAERDVELKDSQIRSNDAATFGSYYDILNPDNPYQFFNGINSAGYGDFSRKDLERIARDYVEAKKKGKK